MGDGYNLHDTHFSAYQSVQSYYVRLWRMQACRELNGASFVDLVKIRLLF